MKGSLAPANFAFRIGYLADGFQGYARQPGRSTVEGVLREGVRRLGVLAPGGERAFRTASRTDRGVHALGNVVSFPTRLSGAAATRVLSSIDPRIFGFGYAPVGEGFEPRHARERWYRYLHPAEGTVLERWREGGELFVGEHDFASFSRRDDPPRRSRGSLREFQVASRGGLLEIDVRAPGFLWNQVRKMVAALDLLDRGKLTNEDLEMALEGRRVLQLPLAPASGLVLMDVSYDFPFTQVVPGLSAQRRALLEAGRREARTRETLLGWFQSRALPPPGRTSEP